MQEVRNEDTKNSDGDCILTVMIGGTSSLVESIVIELHAANVIEFPEPKSESRCENGVCSLNWEPKRNVA